MPKFNVRITRHCDYVQTLTVEVEADSAEEAEELADDRYNDGGYDSREHHWRSGDDETLDIEFNATVAEA